MFYLTEISEITRLVFDIECWMQQTGISLSDVYKADWRSNNIYYEMSADLLSRERERERGLLRPEAPTHRPVLGTEQRDERDFSTHLPRHFLTTPFWNINGGHWQHFPEWWWECLVAPAQPAVSLVWRGPGRARPAQLCLSWCGETKVRTCHCYTSTPTLPQYTR